MSLTKVTNTMISGAVVNVFDYMTPAMIADVQARTNLIDTTAAIQAAIDSLAPVGGNYNNRYGGTIELPNGSYLTTSELTLSTNGIALVGQSGVELYGLHAGNSILNLKGSIGTTVSNIGFRTGPTSGLYPKSGLILGRTSAASSSNHKIMNISVVGNFSTACIYSIASEDNYWQDIYVWLFGGGAKYCFYTSERDDLALGPLTQSTNLDNKLFGLYLISSSFVADSACIYMNTGEGTGDWSFFGAYLIPFTGSYIEIASGFIDTAAALGPFTFHGVAGERFSGGDPLYGFKLTRNNQVELKGLSINNCRFDLLAGANHYQVYVQPDLILAAPNIVIQPPDAFPYASNSQFLPLIRGGIYNVGRNFLWTALTLATDYSNTLGAPYAQASYCIDPNGFVRLRGQIVRSGAGSAVLFVLPVDIRPVVNLIFPTMVGTGMGEILVTAATGEVSLTAGAVTDAINLSPIQYNCH